MPHRLSRKELRIIEETKREGEKEFAEPGKKFKTGYRTASAVIIFIAVFCLMAFLMKLLVTALG